MKSDMKMEVAEMTVAACGPVNLNLDLLEQVLSVPTHSQQEHQMVEFLMEHVRQRGSTRCGSIVSDQWNNVLIRKGDAEGVPCVAAHLDTVHSLRPVEIVEQDGLLFGVDERGERTGCGADDKAGVLVCLELLERFENIVVAFFAAEEIGCMGAKHAPASWFEDVGYVIEFDAPGAGLVSYTSSGTRLFANNGDFIQTAMPALQTHGLTRFQNHPYSDVMALRQRFSLSCLNLSCGFHNWHRSDEYLVIEEVEAAIKAGATLVEALGCRAYPFEDESGDLAEPVFEVTGLQLD